MSALLLVLLAMTHSTKQSLVLGNNIKMIELSSMRSAQQVVERGLWVVGSSMGECKVTVAQMILSANHQDD